MYLTSDTVRMIFLYVNTSDLRLRSWLERPPKHSRLLEEDTEAAEKIIISSMSNAFVDRN